MYSTCTYMSLLRKTFPYSYPAFRSCLKNVALHTVERQTGITRRQLSVISTPEEGNLSKAGFPATTTNAPLLTTSECLECCMHSATAHATPCCPETGALRGPCWLPCTTSGRVPTCRASMSCTFFASINCCSRSGYTRVSMCGTDSSFNSGEWEWNQCTTCIIAVLQLHSVVPTIIDLHCNILLCGLLRQDILENSESGQVVCSEL